MCVCISETACILCYAFTLSLSRANLFSSSRPLCVQPDRYLRLPDLVEHGCCWVIPNNDYVLVGATSLTFLIYTGLPTYVFPSSFMTPLHFYVYVSLSTCATSLFPLPRLPYHTIRLRVHS